MCGEKCTSDFPYFSTQRNMYILEQRSHKEKKKIFLKYKYIKIANRENIEKRGNLVEGGREG